MSLILPRVSRSFDEEEGTLLASYGGEVDLTCDWELSVAPYAGERDGDLVRRDPNPLAQKAL